MQKWEYLVARVELYGPLLGFDMSVTSVSVQPVVKGGFTKTKLDFPSWLRDRGVEGWELVSSSDVSGSGSLVPVSIFTLKRPIP